MQNKSCVLVIEDDLSIRNFITTSLSTQGYKYIEASKGSEAISLTLSHCPDLLILDLGLPDIDGTEVIRRIRELSKIPIIVVSARDFERQKIEALDLGADDYLTKPFGIGELLARVRVLLRNKMDVDSKPKDMFTIHDLQIDYEKRKVVLEGEPVHLTPNEYKILTLLSTYPGKVLTHTFLTKEIWGSSLGNETQTLRVFMASLRRKIEKDPSNPSYIFTEVGVGYRFADE